MVASSNILFLYGDDEYAIARRLREFTSIFADASEAQMNTAHLDARTMTENDWVNAVNALPFMAKHRLVILANPSARFARPKPKAGEAENGEAAQGQASTRAAAESQAEARQKFLLALQRVPPTTRLVMWEALEVKFPWNKARQETEDSRHWLIAWMQKRALELERYALPTDRDMPGWIIQYAKAQGGEIAGAAASRLADMVGTDTRQAAQEVTKLLTYVNWSRPVTAADVEALSPLTAAPDVFEMLDALAAGRSRQAQRLLHRLLENQDAFSTWGMIIRQFRLVLLAREVLDGGGGEAEAVKALGAQPFVAKKALGQARGFTMPRLEMIYHRLLEIDEGAKTGRMPLDVALDVLLAELAG
ncbi:MAG: DNA polymerase III subunit delta [Chloroflexota bacterium]